MQTTGNTVLITGGGSGIGLALAGELAKRGNRVVIAARSAERLEAAAHKGFAALPGDLSDPGSIKSLARKVLDSFPTLNVVIHNAGIMKNENLRAMNTEEIATETIATNLAGPILLTMALLPHLLKQARATIMTVSSGLAFVPLAMTPTYSATKAAIHSWTQSLRYQLRDSSIQVIELVPPYVQTGLMGRRQAEDSAAMPLGQFVSEVMEILTAQPHAVEILVRRVHPLRFAASEGAEKYETIFREMNDRIGAARAAEF
ncbi:MAG TPA: SDR family NAD(P)-dependent oxidoreductase [Steroidobacteraceae bacterium]|nr:SDR family NAD(P)-dependent oxidoreductase [Steroidobacteraceae bacterium]